MTRPDDRLLPGVPMVESPLFDTELDASALPPAERDIAVALNRDGYAVIDFPDPDFDARIERIRERLMPRFADTGRSAEGVFHAHGRIQDAWLTDADVQAIAANRQVLDLLGRLYGRPAFPFQTLNFRAGTQQALHTDAVHFSSIPPRFMCGVWVAMEDIMPDSGPLHYVPGSHRWPIMDNALIGRKGFGQRLESAQLPYQHVWDTMMDTSGTRPETFLARKGQALIWCANLLHGGSPQNDPALSRWSQVTHYYFDDCIYYTPALSDEYLGRLQLRQLVSVTDRAPRPNLYLGEEILPPQATIKQRRKGVAAKLRRWAHDLRGERGA